MMTTALAVAMALPAAGAPAAKCVQIFYDRAPQAEPPHAHGRTHALMAQNLLGHFPHIQQYVIPVERYEGGMLDRCFASLYLGTYYDNALPEAFVDDFATTRRHVAWAGYNVWRLGPERLRNLWDVEFRGLSKLDREIPEADGKPGFFRDYEYRGEVFRKYGEMHPSGLFMAAWEISLVRFLDPASEATAVSWALHSTKGTRTPYLVRRANRWLFADVPTTFITEEDRYLIFADALFDLVGEAPARGPKRALVRLEDVHSALPLPQLEGMLSIFERLNVPFTISLIPRFRDPFHAMPQAAKPQEDFVENAAFLAFLRRALGAGGTLGWHGVTHQADGIKNPFNGLSGTDYEFWDVAGGGPMPQDSARWVTERLEEAFSLFRSVGLRPRAWITPHYLASPLDHVLFGQLFLWNIGRVTYAPHALVQKRRLPPLMTFDLSGVEYNGQRVQYFLDAKIAPFPGAPMAGQFFPYEIHGDAYGQRLLPENLGFVQVVGPGSKPVGVDGILARLRRNRVLRDAWGSFFLHPALYTSIEQGGLAEFPGDSRELERLLRGVRELGYEFVNLASWSKANLKRLRPEPIEIY